MSDNLSYNSRCNKQKNMEDSHPWYPGNVSSTNTVRKKRWVS